MADDGSAGNIYIPSFLINEVDGEIIKEFLNDPQWGDKVAFELHFEMPHPDNSVEYELWMTSDNQVIRDFLSNFSQV